MPRLQFTLCSLLLAMLVVALVCSILVNLPLSAIISGSMASLVVLSWFRDWAITSPSAKE